MAITKIPAAGFTSNNFRNIIINGDMSIAQRGTSVSGITDGLTYHTVDRMKTQITTAGTWTQTQDTDVPTGQGFVKSFKMNCTTANASLDAASFANVRQDIEGQNLQYLKYGTSNAESLTLSFWVKSNKTGIYIIWLFANDVSNRHISKSYTINTADTWEKKTITFAGDTAQAFTNDNDARLRVYFILAAGSNSTSGTLATSWESFNIANRAIGQVNLADSTSNYINITGVQLEAGTTASDFEFLPYDVNLLRCQRYYQIISAAGGNSVISVFQVTGTGSAIGSIPNLIEMRGTATFSTTGSFNIWTATAGSNAAGTLSLFTSTKTQQGVSFTRTSGSTLTAGDAGGLFSSAGSSSILLSAEL